MITRQFRPILTPPLRLSFRPNSSTASSLTDDLRDRILVYRNSLRKVDTSSNQLCASLDKVRASGKLLSFRLAGNCTGCGQSTLCIGSLLAHPVNITRQPISTSESGITLFPSGHKGLCLLLLSCTVLFLHDTRLLGIVSAHFLDVFLIERGRVLVASSKNGGTRYKYRHIFQDKAIHLSASFQAFTAFAETSAIRLIPKPKKTA